MIQLLITMVSSETMAIRSMEMVEAQLESQNTEVMESKTTIMKSEMMVTQIMEMAEALPE